jgi:hypothetical protein
MSSLAAWKDRVKADIRTRSSTLAISFALIATPAAAQFAHFNPRGEYVPDASTAIAIGHAVAIPIYGQKLVQSEEPFTATRKGDSWTVQGTLHCPQSSTCVGGTVEVTLSAKDGHVLSVIHTE